MKDIIILGTGGNCFDILDAILEVNRAGPAPAYRALGFLDDDAAQLGREFFGCKILGPLSSARNFRDCFFVNGIGSPRNFWKKPQIIASTEIPADRFESVIHPRAAVSQFASVGWGTVVLQNATVNANARVGDHVMILPGSVISHDAAIGDYSCVASCVCVAGGVQTGSSCYLGANCSLNNGVKIGAGSLIGMGAVVLKDVPAGVVVVGNPARVIRKTRDGDAGAA